MAYFDKKDEVKELRDKIKLDPEGAYIFWGEEEYLKHYYLGELRRLVEDEGMAEFNRTVLDFRRDATVKELDEAVKTPPVMATRKIVEVFGFEFISQKKEKDDEDEGAKKSEPENKDAKVLLDAVKNMPDGVILVIFIRSSELELSAKQLASKKIIKELDPYVTRVEFPRQSEQKLLSWVDKIFRTAEVRISDVNITRMIKLCDYSMTRLKNDAEKIIAYCKFNSLDCVPNEIIDALVKPTAENEVYEFSGALTRRARRETMEILENLKMQNLQPVMLLAVISKAVNNLAVVKSARSSVQSAELAKRLGISEFQIKYLKKDAENWSEASLKRAVELIFECDNELKSQRTDEYATLTALLTEILGA